jgi:hypothetical protein
LKITEEIFKNMVPVGPADYNNVEILGKDHIAKSQIKAAPRFSFTRARTFRFVTSRSRSASKEVGNSRAAN